MPFSAIDPEDVYKICIIVFRIVFARSMPQLRSPLSELDVVLVLEWGNFKDPPTVLGYL